MPNYERWTLFSPAIEKLAVKQLVTRLVLSLSDEKMPFLESYRVKELLLLSMQNHFLFYLLFELELVFYKGNVTTVTNNE